MIHKFSNQQIHIFIEKHLNKAIFFQKLFSLVNSKFQFTSGVSSTNMFDQINCKCLYYNKIHPMIPTYMYINAKYSHTTRKLPQFVATATKFAPIATTWAGGDCVLAVGIYRLGTKLNAHSLVQLHIIYMYMYVEGIETYTYLHFCELQLRTLRFIYIHKYVWGEVWRTQIHLSENSVRLCKIQ